MQIKRGPLEMELWTLIYRHHKMFQEFMASSHCCEL
jgi:hypothetical protein